MMDRLVRELQHKSLLTGVILSVSLWVAATVAIQYFGFKRILPSGDLALLLAVSLCLQYSAPQASSLRFCKIEPFMVVSMVSGVLVTLNNLVSAIYFDVSRMCWGFFLFSGVMVLIWVNSIYGRILRAGSLPDDA
jgi:hypothetical protein